LLALDCCTRANKLLVPVTAGDAAAAYRGGFICRDVSAIRASERASESARRTTRGCLAEILSPLLPSSRICEGNASRRFTYTSPRSVLHWETISSLAVGRGGGRGHAGYFTSADNTHNCRIHYAHLIRLWRVVHGARHTRGDARGMTREGGTPPPPLGR